MVKNIALFISGLFLFVNAHAEVKDLRNVGVDDVDFTLESQFTRFAYAIHVYLPDGIDNIEGKLPVIYETDAQWNFNLLKKKLKARHLNVIVVGIEGGDNDRRAVDYRMPVAADYYQFLTKELIPEIEQHYKADSKNRTIMGHSYGGLFVGLCVLFDNKQKQFFTNYWSFDGSFPELNKKEYLPIRENQRINPQFRGTLILTGASVGGNANFVVSWAKAMAPFFPSLKIEKKIFDVDHATVIGPSLKWVLDSYSTEPFFKDIP